MKLESLGPEQEKEKKYLNKNWPKNFPIDGNCEPTSPSYPLHPSTRNMNRTIPRHIKINFLKTSNKDIILKAARKKKKKEEEALHTEEQRSPTEKFQQFYFLAMIMCHFNSVFPTNFKGRNSLQIKKERLGGYIR